ncbi:geranylgeranyl transferase type-2 subunit alpha-like isoform X1 [Rhopilema esculentum]|uniref:geranylgeranyl transferase type-2 subunit alpha-like isoform X1 n=1 Tax=Rhopilema esculentum TaxID=499914 RepID=UPI0031DED891
MHGVLKVKTTAEQEAERKKERAEKAEKFKTLTEEIFNKRKNEELDDELLKLTEKLLGSNPDFSTMWNIRKEIFLKIKQQRSDDEMNELFLHELKFLQSCLHVNPKSYGVWEHRRFALQNMPSPDWKRDLMLCNKFLSMDSRNFHCWDYRRFVVKNANVSSKEEFDFTTKKISENFSNYSAWHNRAKLLPLVHPDPQCKGKVEETALLREFGLVQNAFFTDPNDQSAWFYQRWLLGRGMLRQDF